MGVGVARDRPWIWWILAKVFVLVAVILLLISVDFAMFRVYRPDGSSVLIPKTANQSFLEQIYNEFHLNDSLATQYVDYVADTLRLDFHFGISYRRGVEIGSYIGDSVVTTLLLFAGALLCTLLIGIVFEAKVLRLRRRSSRRLMRLGSAILLSVPAVALVEAIKYADMRAGGILPRPDYYRHLAGLSLGRAVESLVDGVIPVLICALASFGLISFIALSARSKSPGTGGRLESIVDVMHRMNSNPTFVKFFFAWVLCCVLAVDFMFGYGGLGTLVWDAIYYVDGPVLMATFYVSALILVALNFAYDVIVSPEARRIDRYHEEEVLARIGHSQRASSARMTPLISAKRILKDYRKSRAGMLALTMLIAFALIALIAPIIATVENPNDFGNTEENYLGQDRDQDLVNPLAPSLTPHQISGVLHPMGTDLYGRDVYSMMLYGTRGPLLVGIIISLLSIGHGVISGIAGASMIFKNGIARSFTRWTAVVVSDTFIAIPILVFVAGPLLFQRSVGIDLPTIAVLATIGIQLWATIFVARGTRRTASHLAEKTAHLPSTAQLAPTILRQTLFVTKFAILLGMVSILTLEMVGLYFPTTFTWGTVLKSVIHSGALCCFRTWWAIFPPLVMSMAFTASAFVAVDTLERVIRLREAPTDADSVQPTPVTAA